jgi:glycosyltransferase involved in cell wall biosynthesis
VLPRLRQQVGCVIRFIGSLVPAALASDLAAAGCAVHADVDDVLPFLHRARAVFVPLRTAGGTRLKIVEAWAAGVPVVSTPLGAAGLDAVDGMDVLLAADARQFADALQRVIEDDGIYIRLRENGLRRAATLRWSQQAPLIEAAYRTATSAAWEESA